jgi:hypothetical protein
VRRLIAIAGGANSVGPAHVLLETQVPPIPDVDAVVADLVGEPAVIHEFSEPFRAPDGQTYRVRAVGQGRADGTWIGWLSFVAPDGRTVRRTPRETSQSSREHLDYWATGLQPLYFEGAFSRSSVF